MPWLAPLLAPLLCLPGPTLSAPASWLDAARPYRVRIALPAGSAAGRARAELRLDLLDDLARLGLPSAVEGASMRLVEDATGAEVPAEMRDGRLAWAAPAGGQGGRYTLYFGPTAPPGAPGATAAVDAPDYAREAYGSGWEFDRDDFEGIDTFGDRPANIRARSVEGGVMKLDVTGDAYFIWGDMWGSPQRSKRPVSIDLDRYSVLEMRIRQSVSDAEWCIFGRPGRGGSLLRYPFRVQGAGWQTVRVDLRGQARWRGVLTAFRIDPSKHQDAHVEFDWVRLLAVRPARRGAVEVRGSRPGAAAIGVTVPGTSLRAGSEHTVRVAVRGAGDAPLAAQPVRLSLEKGSGGALAPVSGRSGLAIDGGVRALTDDAGVALFTYRVSSKAGAAADRLLAEAEHAPAPPARARVAARPGPPAQYVVRPSLPRIVRGRAPVRVTVRLADALGNPLPGRRRLTWSAEGASLERAAAATGADGSASAVLRGDPSRRWMVRVQVRDAQGLAGSSAPVCVLPTGPRPNPVRIGATGYFETGGKAWLPLGGFYANWVGTRTPDGEWNRLVSFTDATDEQIVEWLALLKRSGVTAQRFMLRTHRRDGMEPMDIGGRVNPGLFAAFMHYLDLARPFGLRFLLVLHEDYTKPLYFDGDALERYALPWYAGHDLDRLPPAQRRFIRDRKLIDDIGDKYTDPDVMACQDRYAREIVGLMKGHPSVFAYELENEMVDCPASWVDHQLQVIRSVDPSTPLCVSHGGGGLFTADPAWWMAKTAVDFYTPHIYPDGPVTTPEIDYGLAVDVLMRYVGAGKPAFLGESAGDQFAHHPDRDVRRYTMRDIIWLSLVNGRPGCFFWNARASEVAEFRLANAIAGRIDWTRFRAKRPRVVVAIPHALPNDQWFRSGPGGLAYAEMGRYSRHFLERGADFDFAIGAPPADARVLDGTRFADPGAVPADFAVSDGHQLASLVRADSREALVYTRCFAGVERWESRGEPRSSQHLRRRAPARLTVTVRMPGRHTADVWDLDTGAHFRHTLAEGAPLDLGVTDHDFAIHLARLP